MSKKIKILFYLLGLVIPVALVFSPWLYSNLSPWGDAPHFFPEEHLEFLSEPSAWTQRGINLGGPNLRLYISPLLILLGALKLNSSFFLFPSILLSLLGPWVLSKELKLPLVVRFFSSLLYSLNTYYLLLIDGGQVGVALAYGLFPLTFAFLLKLKNKNNINNFYLSLFFLLILTITDPRVSFICFFSFIVWKLLERKLSKRLIKTLSLLAISLLSLSLYWLIPLFQSSATTTEVGLISNIKLIHSLTLFQPHWPSNIFGQVSLPPLLFYIIPIIIFTGLFIKSRNKLYLPLTTGYFLFAFLTTGSYLPYIKNIPFSFAFRDSTKFFIPIMLFSGILIGLVAKKINKLLITLLLYFVTLILIYPALSHNLNFMLSFRSHSPDFQFIYKNIKADQNSFRTAWFPERHPLTFETKKTPALDAKDLVNNWPLAFNNTGSFDKFNYLHNPSWSQWFELLGIKYLIFPNDVRALSFTKEQEKNWASLLDTISSDPNIQQVDWNTNIPIFKLKNNPAPQMFTSQFLYAVIGPPVTDKPLNAIYFEDGKLDPQLLNGIEKDALKLVFNKKTESDLVLSFLQNYFQSCTSAKKSQWAQYASTDYLTYKYQLLIRNIDFDEFDYGLGICFSTNPNEESVYKLTKKQEGSHVLALRIYKTNESKLTVYTDNKKYPINTKDINQFQWILFTDFDQSKNKIDVKLVNENGTNLINAIALIPQKDFQEAQGSANTFLKHFKTVEKSDIPLDQKLKFSAVGPEEFEKNLFRVNAHESAFWIIHTNSYNPNWKIENGVKEYSPVPVYSMVNGYYINPDWRGVQIYYQGQKEFRWGLYWSGISVAVLTIIYLYKASKKG